jgi:PAS domain S-box-containing protein
MAGDDLASLRLAAIVQYSDDAIISKDLNGIVQSWNPAAERMFGYTAEEMIGRSIRTIIPPDRQDEEDRVLARIRAGEVIGHYETIRMRKDGSPVMVSLTVSPIRESTGQIIGASKIVRDIGSQRSFEREAFILGAIVTSADDAIISKDLNGVVQTWNRAAERMFGYTADEAIGRPIAELVIPPDRMDEEAEVLTKIRAGEGIEHFETIRRRKDGSTLEISLTVSPIKDRMGRIIGASKIARDATERNMLVRDLERANRMKDEFLATLSHELRTPLNAIMGYSRIIGQRGADEPTRRAADAIARNGQALTQLVSDILDMSAVAAGKTRMEMAWTNLGTVVTEALDVVASAAEGKGVSIVRDVPIEGTEIRADAGRLRQVFWNLLSNAVKFTPRGGTIRVRLDFLLEELAVTVSDTGVGMDPAFVPHIFKRFTQADTSASREFGGIGIGLALVRHYVELHGGSVSAYSEGPGLGSSFAVMLPRLSRPAERKP